MFDFLIVGYRHFFVFLYEYVGFALAILLTSVISSFLVKPIAKVVAKIVKRQASYEAVLNPLVTKINASEKTGAEKQFLLQELYRRYAYSPIYATRKVLPMFVQMPLLFLTYYMLQGADILNGVSFLCFKDLGAADALLPMGINLLPFLMTGINILAIYSTVSFTRQDRIQTIVVALLFLWMLYPACAALMIYWTLNNLFTCLKTLAEEHYSGARLLWGRIRYLFDPKTFAEIVGKISNLNKNYYVFASFICLILSIHACIVLTGKFGGGSFSGKIAVIVMHEFLVLAVILMVPVFQRAKYLLLTLSFLMLCLQFGVIAEKVVVNSFAWKARHATILTYLFYVHLAVTMTVLTCLQIKNKVRRLVCGFSFIESGIFTFVLFAIACHYLCSNTLLGLDATSFVVMSGYLIGIVVVLSSMAYFLYGKFLSLQTVIRSLFLICCIFYLMPLFAKGQGWLSPEKSIWLFYVLVFSIGVVFISAYAHMQKFLKLFLVLLACAFIVNGVFTAKEQLKLQKEAPVQKKSVETYSHLDNHEVIKPYNVYVLVYDGYPNPLFLKEYDVYDPSQLLSERGFTLYPRAYAPFVGTLGSMSRFFDIFGDTGLGHCDILSGRAKCLRFLRSQGYMMCYVISEYLMSTAMELEGDFYFPNPLTNLRIENILIRNIRRGFLDQSTDFATFTQEERTKTKQMILAKHVNRPKFLYAHCGPEHTTRNEGFRRSEEEELRMFKERVEVTKGDMKKDLDSVDDLDNSIVIVVSDHGADLHIDENVSPASEIVNRYGCFLAVKWPKNYKTTLDVSYTRNVMLEVMICLTGDVSLAKYEQENILYDGDAYNQHPRDDVKNGVFIKGENEGKSFFDITEKEFKSRKHKKLPNS